MLFRRRSEPKQVALPDPIPVVSPPASCEREVVERYCREVMNAFGLHEWTFCWTRAVRTLGVCRYRDKVIGLSRHMVARNGPAEVRETLLHEVAHALAGSRAGHGPVWKDVARRIGAKTERCSTTAAMPPGRIVAVCGGCRKIFRRHRRPKRLVGWYCKRCGPKAGALTWGRESGAA